MIQSSGSEPETPDEPARPVSAEGVDLTQVRALKAMTPDERFDALVEAANRLRELRSDGREL